MSVNQPELLSRKLKDVLMMVGRNEVPIIDNRISYNEGLREYFEGKGTMTKLVVVGTDDQEPDSIEEGTMVIKKYIGENDFVYYQVGYTYSGATSWVIVTEGIHVDNWPRNTQIITDNTEVENFRKLIGGVARRSEDESTVNHTMITPKRRELLNALGNSIGLDLYCSVSLSGGHCGECRNWTCAMLELMPDYLYKALCNGNVPYSCCTNKDRGGMDHCYVTFAPPNTGPNQWYNNPGNIRVFDLWYRDQFDRLYPGLHYKDGPILSSWGIHPQMDYDLVQNSGNIQKWLNGIPLEHQNKAKTFLYESQAKILFGCSKYGGEDFVKQWDSNMKKLLEDLEGKVNSGDFEVTIEDMAYLHEWAQDLSSRTDEENNESNREKRALVDRCNIVRDTLNGAWKGYGNCLDNPDSTMEACMQKIKDFIENGGYVEEGVLEKWTVLYLESIIRNSNDQDECLKAIDRLTLHYVLTNANDIDYGCLNVQQQTCQNLQALCLARGDDGWKNLVNERFERMYTLMDEMLESWNRSRNEGDDKITGKFTS